MRNASKADHILDSALKQFSEHGYDGASMSKIAKSAGISKATLYHHFSSKEDLLSQVCVKAWDGLTDHETGSLEGVTRENFFQRLIETSKKTIHSFQDHSAAHKLVLSLMPVMNEREEVRMSLQPAIASNRLKIKEMLVLGKRLGVLRPNLDLNLTTLEIFLFYDAIRQSMAFGQNLPLDQLLEDIIPKLLGGEPEKDEKKEKGLNPFAKAHLLPKSLKLGL